MIVHGMPLCRSTLPDRWESAALLSSRILHDAQEIRDCQKELLKQKTTSKNSYLLALVKPLMILIQKNTIYLKTKY